MSQTPDWRLKWGWEGLVRRSPRSVGSEPWSSDRHCQKRWNRRVPSPCSREWLAGGRKSLLPFGDRSVRSQVSCASEDRDTRGRETWGKTTGFSYNRRENGFPISVSVYNVSILKRFALRRSMLIECARDFCMKNTRLLE